MEIKDHYQALGLTPSADLAEIKKAYRRLAHAYHPDKNAGDVYAAARFADIKEAYEVLSNPSRKEYYLQQRWYQQSTGLKRTQETITPVSVLKQALELDRYVSKLDIYRMDKQGLYDYTRDLLSGETIEKLNEFGEINTNSEIARILLNCLHPLPVEQSGLICKQLDGLHTDKATKEKIQQWIGDRRKQQKKERYNIWVLLLIVLIICLVMYFLGRVK